MMSDWIYGARDYPLDALARKLTLAPPSLNDMISQLQDGEILAEFLALVKEYVPEHEAEIMALPHDDRVLRFASHFERQYFPLYTDMFMEAYERTEMYWQIVHTIPIVRFAFSWEDYHEIETLRPGYVMLMTLVDCPFGVSDGAMVPIREATAGLCGEHIVRRIPENGWDSDKLEEWLKGTEYACVGMFGQWLHRNTGSPWLDLSFDEEEYGDLGWERELVDYMTRQWPITDTFLGEITDLAVKLESDPGLLRDVVGRIEERSRQLSLPINEEGKTLVEVFNDARR